MPASRSKQSWSTVCDPFRGIGWYRVRDVPRANLLVGLSCTRLPRADHRHAGPNHTDRPRTIFRDKYV